MRRENGIIGEYHELMAVVADTSERSPSRHEVAGDVATRRLDRHRVEALIDQELPELHR